MRISGPQAVQLVGRALRRATYPLTALPVDLGGLALLLVRSPRRPTDEPPSTPSRLSRTGPQTRHPIGSVLARLPLDTVAFVVAAYVWLLLPINWAFPLRPDVGDEPLRGTWGGPTIAGAWAVHALGATLVFLVIGLPFLNGLTWVQQRFTRHTPSR